jgi:hypothetical protein
MLSTFVAVSVISSLLLVSTVSSRLKGHPFLSYPHTNYMSESGVVKRITSAGERLPHCSVL